MKEKISSITMIRSNHERRDLSMNSPFVLITYQTVSLLTSRKSETSSIKTFNSHFLLLMPNSTSKSKHVFIVTHTAQINEEKRIKQFRVVKAIQQSLTQRIRIARTRTKLRNAETDSNTGGGPVRRKEHECPASSVLDPRRSQRHRGRSNLVRGLP
jgi:hypothetical protein